jgi:phage N-6-adenine-methyltransferase
MSMAETMFYPAPSLDRNKWLRPGLMTSDSVEWYTPAPILGAVLATLGAIDLDPCADPEKTVPATRHYTEDDNGLGHTWEGRVYMNPPYGRTIIAWTTKLRDELHRGWVTEAVALLPARVDTRWWQELAPPEVCFIRGRIQFSGYEQSAPFPSAAAYFGGHPEAFQSAFRGLGQLYRAVE